jgi:uncharacterized Zn-binding protein involved in type VI secretion
MPFAATIKDKHICPLTNPPPTSTPHTAPTGNPITPLSPKTVLIGGSAAATVGDTCVCAGPPPNSITQGSTTVKINGKFAARMGDKTAHGGSIISGCATVIIGG